MQQQINLPMLQLHADRSGNGVSGMPTRNGNLLRRICLPPNLRKPLQKCQSPAMIRMRGTVPLVPYSPHLVFCTDAKGGRAARSVYEQPLDVLLRRDVGEHIPPTAEAIKQRGHRIAPSHVFQRHGKRYLQYSKVGGLQDMPWVSSNEFETS